MNDTHTRLSDALVGRYRIERELGEGGMATVFLAHDLKHDRKVAVKVLKPEIGSSVGADRFLREIRLAARLAHPHILPLHDSGEASGLLYFVMPYVEGQSLRGRMNDIGMLSVPEAVRITREIAEALDHAHRQGVIHRDIKPENIMLQEGHALVADFGIGKAVSDVENQFTQTGATVGTPAYMSPEQAAGDVVDGRSDLYSLGCVLYEMLVGEQPFTGVNAQAVMAKRFVQTPADVAVLRQGVPQAVSQAVKKVLARAAVDRHETGSQLAAALAKTEVTPQRTKSSAAPEKSIAVLPFANMSADPENEFFADGITEEILNALAQIGELRVAGRTSAFSFKGKDQDLHLIGEQLHVRTVLEGSVRRAGSRVRITAQLIDVTNGYHLWSERYDREIADVFAVQDEIASAIAVKLRTTLRITDAAKSQRATDSIEAYEAYLKGRTLLCRRGPSIKYGLAEMEKALALDPTYGLAWSGLADAYTLLGYYGIVAPEVARAKAVASAAKALEFAPDLAETQTAHAMVCLLFEWDWAEAARSFKSALEINPGYLQGANWYYQFYKGIACRQWDAALRGAKACWSLDTLSGFAAAVVTFVYVTGFRDREVLEWSERASRLESDPFLANWLRQMAYHSIGEWDLAIAAAQVTLVQSGRAVLPLAWLGVSYNESGNRGAAQSVYDELRSRAQRDYVSPMVLAVLAAMLDERDAAEAYCDEAFQRHDPLIVIVSHGWVGAQHLQALPAFQRVLRDIGLTQWAAADKSGSPIADDQ